MQAASFLQNVVYINLTLSEQEKIQRFETLSDLYSQIGFTRKAAFCQRMAATRYVSPQNRNPNWNQCYSLMLQSFPGHKISLDPTEMGEGSSQVGKKNCDNEISYLYQDFSYNFYISTKQMRRLLHSFLFNRFVNSGKPF